MSTETATAEPLAAASAAGIPRRLITIGRDPETSMLARGSRQTLVSLHPDFEYLHIGYAEMPIFLETHMPQYRALFDSFPLEIQRYDFFRYLALYQLGGFYFDQDVLLSKPLTPLLASECVFPFEKFTINGHLADRLGQFWEIGTYGFGCRPRHPFLRAVIDNCVRAQEDPAWVHEVLQHVPRPFRDGWIALCTTGPLLVSRTFAEYDTAHAPVDVLFPPEPTDPTWWFTFGDYGVHLMEGSWRAKSGMLKRKLEGMWRLNEERRRFPAATAEFHQRWRSRPAGTSSERQSWVGPMRPTARADIRYVTGSGGPE